MRIIKSNEQGELANTMKEKQLERFLERLWLDVVNDQGEAIGKVIGYSLQMKEIQNDFIHTDGQNVLREMSRISDLCYQLCNFLNYNRDITNDESNLYYLNHLYLREGYNSIEQEDTVLRILHDEYGAIIYSFGSTELDDVYVEENTHTEEDWAVRGEHLEKKWELNEMYHFFIQRKYSIKPLISM